MDKKSLNIKKPEAKIEAIAPSVETKQNLGRFGLTLESLKATMHNKYVKIGAVILSVIAVGYGGKLAYEAYVNRNTDSSVPAEENICAPTWLMRGNGHNNGDFVEGGIAGIKEVDRNVDPKDILYTWLDKIDDDRTTLDFVAESFHKNADKKDVPINKELLTDMRGCATDVAVKEADYIKEKIKHAKVNYGLAPVDGANSYVTDKNEVARSAVTEREAIIIDFGNGEKLYVVGICGNLVDEKEYTIIKETKEKKVIIKKDKKDDHKDRKDKPSKKDPSKDPAAQNNAPKGSGLNKDTSAGQFTAPSEVKKPEQSSSSVSKTTVTVPGM